MGDFQTAVSLTDFLCGAAQRQVRAVDCVSVLDGQACSDDVLDAFTAAANQLSPCVGTMPANEMLAQPCTILDQLTLCVNSARPDVACSQPLLDAYRRAVAWFGDRKVSALTVQLLPGMTTGPPIRVPDATSFGVAAVPGTDAEFAHSTALAPNLGPLASNAHENDKNAKSGTDLIAGGAENVNRNGTLDGDQANASRLNTQDLAVYLSISAATLAVLCAMGALMTWKALESKRRRLAGLDDDDDLMVDDEAVDTFLAAGQADSECASGDLLGDQQMAVFSSNVPEDDDPLRWNSMSELSPISSDLHSPWDPTSPSSSFAQSDVAILFGPGAVMTPVSDGDHLSPPPLLLPSDTASDATVASTSTSTTTTTSTTAAAASSKKKRSRGDNSSKAAPVSSTSSSSSGAAQVQPQSKIIVVTSDGASSRRARPPVTVVAPPATKSAVAAFMSAGARSTKLSYGTKLPSASAPTATATASASTSAKTSAKSSPVESTPSPAPVSGTAGEEDGAFSNIKLPSL
jgi:hypothetical protein